MRKLALVTGASTGIGFELASIAAEEGYDLLVAANENLINAAAADFGRQMSTSFRSKRTCHRKQASIRCSAN